MTSIELSAPAKINLLLKVLSKRPDGYHNIHTIFERIALADNISIKRIPAGIKVRSNIPITRDQKDNLAYKAARLIIKGSNIPYGVDIRIRKRIPIAAGLGGGSSDAAAVLSGINKLFKLRLNKKKLVRLGARLGSDVPFFLLNEPFALGRGRGERLKAIRSKQRFWHMVIYPGFKLATKDVYKAYDSKGLAGNRGLRSGPGQLPKDLTSTNPNVKIQLPLKLPLDFGTMESMLCNDLENAAVSQKSVIGIVLKRLATLLGKKAVVSGSGPSVFCLYRTRKEAENSRRAILARVPARERKDWQVFIIKTC